MFRILCQCCVSLWCLLSPAGRFPLHPAHDTWCWPIHLWRPARTGTLEPGGDTHTHTNATLPWIKFPFSLGLIIVGNINIFNNQLDKKQHQHLVIFLRFCLVNFTFYMFKLCVWALLLVISCCSLPFSHFFSAVLCLFALNKLQNFKPFLCARGCFLLWQKQVELPF